MKLSVQLYTVRDLMDKDPAGTLASLHKIGLRYVELAGYAGKSAEEFNKMVKGAGLKVSGMHIGMDAAEKNLPQILDDAALFGCKHVIVPWAAPGKNKAEWEALGIKLHAIGEKVAKERHVFGYHNHAHEFAMADGKTGFDIMFSAACPDHLKCQIDLWWAYVGMGDPAALVKQYGSRVRCVHLKDGETRKGDAKQMIAGQGAMKWEPVIEACKNAGVEFGSIEFDTCPGPEIECVKASLDFFRSHDLTE
ncbi:MAG: sugar phosphate isomerase/epimerase [Fimbriimonadaceae bacterium]